MIIDFVPLTNRDWIGTRWYDDGFIYYHTEYILKVRDILMVVCLTLQQNVT